ncbi:MAG: hypothetical protein LBJ16_02450 [Holosporaceae bacterium]|nr:hypothetical protein [Holosporaceae bacterium]
MRSFGNFCVASVLGSSYLCLERSLLGRRLYSSLFRVHLINTWPMIWLI